jgi:ferredoxin like protein
MSTVEDKLAALAMKAHDESHIVPDQARCTTCTTRPCIPACPAELWAHNADTGEITVEHAGCLECGTCLLVCPLDAVEWRYPDGGFGVQYRYG